MQENMTLHKLATLTHSQTTVVSRSSATDSEWLIQGRTEWYSGQSAKWNKWGKQRFERSTS